MRGIGQGELSFQDWVDAVDVTQEKWLALGGSATVDNFAASARQLAEFKVGIAAIDLTEQENNTLCTIVNYALAEGRFNNDVHALCALIGPYKGAAAAGAGNAGFIHRAILRFYPRGEAPNTLGPENLSFKQWVAAVDMTVEQWVAIGGQCTRANFGQAAQELATLKVGIQNMPLTQQENDDLYKLINDARSKQVTRNDVQALCWIQAQYLQATILRTGAAGVMQGLSFSVYTTLLQSQSASYSPECQTFIQQQLASERVNSLVSWPSIAGAAVGGGAIIAGTVSHAVGAPWMLLDIGTGVSIGDVVICSGAWIMAASALCAVSALSVRLVPKISQEIFNSEADKSYESIYVMTRLLPYALSKSFTNLSILWKEFRVAVAYSASQLGVQDVWSDEAVEAKRQELRDAYKTEARKTHTDKGGDSAQFQAMKGHYDLISFYLDRKKYVDLCYKATEQFWKISAFGPMSYDNFAVLTYMAMYLGVVHYGIAPALEMDFVSSICTQAAIGAGMGVLFGFMFWAPEKIGISHKDAHLGARKGIFILTSTLTGTAAATLGPALSHYFVADITVAHAVNVAVAIACIGLLEVFSISLQHTLWAERVAAPTPDVALNSPNTGASRVAGVLTE